MRGVEDRRHKTGDKRYKETAFGAGLSTGNWQLETDNSLFHPITLLFVLIGLALAVGGLWLWGRAGDWSWTQGAERPEIMAMAIRCGGAGIIAAGEWVWIALVVNRIYPDDTLGRLLQWLGAGAMLIALVSAAALGWAAR
jgi:hypothetical protein